MPPELKIQLIAAFWGWAEEEGRTTYIQVQADHGTLLPSAFIVNGVIVLNITSEATNQLHFAATRLSFQGRFGGKVSMVEVPAERISAVFIKDTAIGLVFPIADSPAEGEATPAAPKLSKLSKVSTATETSEKPHNDDEPPPPPKPRLKRL